MIVPYFKAIEEPRFKPRRLAFIQRVASIIEHAFAEVGPVTIRQVYYRAVASGLVESGQESYRKIMSAINAGRKTGMIAWNVIEDRTREPLKPAYHDDLRSALDRLADGFQLDLNAGQRFRIEVWLEQAALEGVLWPVCHDLGVPLVVCGGFTSHDSLFRGAERQTHYASNLGQHGIVFVLSDFDPSGVTMADYIHKMLTGLSDQEVYVQRLGLTLAQAEEHELLGRPLKIDREDKRDDMRAPAFREEHGELAYELDGLPPSVLQDLVRNAITPLIDWPTRASVQGQTDAARARLRELIRIAEQEELF